MRRDPNTAPDSDMSGYNFWLMKLNSFNGDFQPAEMVKAFINSFEYRGRLAQQERELERVSFAGAALTGRAGFSKP